MWARDGYSDSYVFSPFSTCLFYLLYLELILVLSSNKLLQSSVHLTATILVSDRPGMLFLRLASTKVDRTYGSNL